jgi:PAS domain S-box-containing protein
VKKAGASDHSWEQAGIAAAALLGAVWAALPLLLVESPTPESRFLVVALLFAAEGIGSLALAGSRPSACVFAAMLTGVSAVTAAGAATPMGYALAVFAIAYGASIIAVSRLGQQMVLETIASRREVCHRDGIIALSLKEDAGTIPNWIFETDEQGRLRSASAGFRSISGLEEDEIEGHALSEAFLPENTGAGWNRLLLAIAARQAADCAVELVIRGQRMWWQITCQPITGPDGLFAGHTGVAQNITAERQARRRLGDEREQAIQHSNKTAQFLEDVTHEIRAPLNTVLGFAEILNSSSARDLTESESRTYHALLLDSSRSLSAFVADVSDMVRLNRDKLHLLENEVDAAELAEIATKSCSVAAEEADVTILASVFDGVELRCDAFRISRAIVTLVTRAVQASRRGGTVRLCFGKKQDGALVISIIDNGAGLAPTELHSIFEPAIPERGMAGLALPIARLNAMLHGGGLEIESLQGTGTTARLVLPADRVTWLGGESESAARAA